MLAQATGFALLAAISPTALVVMAVFLASASPRQSAIAYVLGACVMTVLMAVSVLLVIRAFGLDQPRQHDPRYELRLGLGVLALLTAAIITVRRSRQRSSDLSVHDPVIVAGGGSTSGTITDGTVTSGTITNGTITNGTAASGSNPGGTNAGGTAAVGTAAGDAGQAGAALGFMSRLVAQPSPRTAFVAGLILFAPSAMFIAAVQVIASARAGTPATVFGLLIVVILTALTAWAPLLAYLSAPEATQRRLGMVNAWLRARGRRLAGFALVGGGVVLVINGALGLAQVI
jgi:hypothetical protein